MNTLELFLVALGLSMDCFAVALCFGTCRKLRWKDILVMALSFGLFQGLMPLIGWFIGDLMQSMIESIDHWLAFGILVFIGLKMIVQSTLMAKNRKSIDIRNWSILLSLSVATSIDAMITGVSFGFIEVNIPLATVIIGAVTFIISVIGAKLGEKSTFIPPRYAEILGGSVLIIIGVRILLTHLSIL